MIHNNNGIFSLYFSSDHRLFGPNTVSVMKDIAFEVAFLKICAECEGWDAKVMPKLSEN